MTRKQTSEFSMDNGRLREILAILAKHNIVRGLTPQKLRAIVEDLGPTFVKLGQILSMRRDMLPAAYCEELSLLRAEVRPMPLFQVEEVVEAECGVPLKELFPVFEEKPLGAASIAQVHAAVLQNGKRVAVKVQRPGIRETMTRDIALLHKAVKLLHLADLEGVVDLDMVLDEMWAVAQQELDFRLEARNAEEFRRLNRDVAFVDCPLVEQSVSSSKLLVMEYIDGIPIDDKESLLAQEYDLNEIGLKLADHYVKQVVEDGFFQADPHPGNLRIRDGKIIWIDLGMMGRLSARDQELLRRGIKAVVRGDVEELKTVVLTLGGCSSPIDHERLYEDIEGFLVRYGSMEIGSMDLGEIFEELMGLAKAHHISVPGGVSMLGRGVLTLEGVLAAISPDINLLQILANRVSASMAREIDWKAELQNGVLWLRDTGRKSASLPSQLSDLLGQSSKGRLKMNVHLVDTEFPLSQMERMTNRRILCAFAIALLIGACLLCLAELTPAWGGVPVLSWIGLAASLLLALWVVWDMHRSRKGKP